MSGGTSCSRGDGTVLDRVDFKTAANNVVEEQMENLEEQKSSELMWWNLRLIQIRYFVDLKEILKTYFSRGSGSDKTDLFYFPILESNLHR